SVLRGNLALYSANACAPIWSSCCWETAPTVWVRPVGEVVVAQAATAVVIARARMTCFMDARSCSYLLWKRCRGVADTGFKNHAGPARVDSHGSNRVNQWMRQSWGRLLTQCFDLSWRHCAAR